MYFFRLIQARHQPIYRNHTELCKVGLSKIISLIKFYVNPERLFVRSFITLTTNYEFINEKNIV